MRRFLWMKLIVFVMFAVGAVQAGAEVPHLIRYQGTVTDTNGVPLEGPYTLTFRIYNAQTVGTKLWEEVQPNVPIVQGSFSVFLGSVTPLDLAFDTDVWLSIQVSTDPEMTPRIRLTSVPTAYRAQVAEQLANPITTSTIEDDANSLVPSGAIILWTGTSCPAGYTRVAGLDGKFLVGSSFHSSNAGGSDTVTLTEAQIPTHIHSTLDHAHSTPDHTHQVAFGPNQFSNDTVIHASYASNSNPSSIETGRPAGTPEGAGTTGAGGGKDTGSTGGGTSFDNRPAYATVLLCQKD